MSNKVINQIEAHICYYLFICILSISNLHRNLRFSTLYAYIINNLYKFYIYILETSQNPRFHENLKIKTQELQNHVRNPRSWVAALMWWSEYSLPHPHSRIILRNFILSLVFASALCVLLIFASAPYRGGCADYWVSSLYDTKRERLLLRATTKISAKMLLFLKKNYLSLTLNIN